MTQLEEEIKTIIEEEIGGKYIGKLKVNVENDYYELLLHMNQEQAPMHFGFQGDEEGFKNFIKEEFHFRKRNDVRYWKAIRDLIDTPINFNNILEL